MNSRINMHKFKLLLWSYVSWRMKLKMKYDGISTLLLLLCWPFWIIFYAGIKKKCWKEKIMYIFQFLFCALMKSILSLLKILSHYSGITYEHVFCPSEKCYVGIIVFLRNRSVWVYVQKTLLLGEMLYRNDFYNIFLHDIVLKYC